MSGGWKIPSIRFSLKGDGNMAKKPKTINVAGMSIKDIMDMDIETFNKLSESDLRAITSRLVSAGNKRIRRLQKAEINSPALTSLGTKTRFSTKLPKNVSTSQKVNKLRQEFSRARQFLAMKTSTISGAKSYVKEIKSNISKSVGRDVSAVNLNRAFELLHKMQERGEIPAGAANKAGSIHARDYIIETMMDKGELSDEDIIKATTKDYNEYYEENETEETEL